MDEDGGLLKEQINQFVWMHLPGETTLDQADHIAAEIHKLMRPDLWEPVDSDFLKHTTTMPPEAIPRKQLISREINIVGGVVFRFGDIKVEYTRMNAFQQQVLLATFPEGTDFSISNTND